MYYFTALRVYGLRFNVSGLRVMKVTQGLQGVGLGLLEGWDPGLQIERPGCGYLGGGESGSGWSVAGDPTTWTW